MRNFRTTASGLLPLTPAATTVLRTITRIGGRPLIVGGAVRDALLARQHGQTLVPKDIDIEVYGVSNQEHLVNALSHLGRLDERGTSFGVIAVNVNGEDFDITLPRWESQTGDGHRGFDIQIAPELDEDIAFGRRDFTVNALGYDPETQELVDPWGGAKDLAAGVLRHTTRSFSEDPLRVLRGVQLAARFNFAMAPGTAEFCRAISARFCELAPERVWGEWRKIARRGTSISQALTVLVETGWIEHFPELDATRGVPQDPAWHPEGDVFTHLGLAADAAAAACDRDGWEDIDREIAVLGALVHDLGKATHTQQCGGRITSHGHAEAGVAPASHFLARIGAPRYLIERILPLVAEHMCHTSTTSATPTKSAVRRLIRRLQPASIIEWAWVVDADCAGRGVGAKESPAPAWVALAHEVGVFPAKGLLRGEHLIQAGLQPGPLFAQILGEALTAQDAGEFGDVDGAKAWLADYLRASRTP